MYVARCVWQCFWNYVKLVGPAIASNNLNLYRCNDFKDPSCSKTLHPSFRTQRFAEIHANIYQTFFCIFYLKPCLQSFLIPFSDISVMFSQRYCCFSKFPSQTFKVCQVCDGNIDFCTKTVISLWKHNRNVRKLYFNKRCASRVLLAPPKCCQIPVNIYP